MKIVHICLNSPYTENWGYQENVLTKYHSKLGNQVTIIANNRQYADSGKIIETELEEYFNQNGVRVIRIPQTSYRVKRIGDILPNYDVYPILESVTPDIIMVHGLIGNLSALQVRRYVRKGNPVCTCVSDIHEDFFVAKLPRNPIKRWLLRTIHRYLNFQMYPYYAKIFYIGLSCKEFARSYYQAPESKLEFLPLGCDPEFIQSKNREQVCKIFRGRYGVESDAILLCHGGKMDELKATAELIEAVKLIHANNKRVELVIFGSITPTYEPTIRKSLLGSEGYIHYIGHLSQQEYYDLYLASDIAVFPGTNSALWEEAIGCGLAVIVKKHVEIEYLDLGGNIEILHEGSVEEIREKLTEIIESDIYINMKEVALEKGLDFFSYEKIAQRVLDCAVKDSPV